MVICDDVTCYRKRKITRQKSTMSEKSEKEEKKAGEKHKLIEEETSEVGAVSEILINGTVNTKKFALV